MSIAELAQPRERIGLVEIEARGVRRRRRQRRVAGRARRRFVEYSGRVSPVALANRRSRPASTSAECGAKVRPIAVASTMGRSRGPVQRDDAGAAEPEVVLQADARAVDLAPVGRAAQLLRQLEALREPGRAQRMPLGQQAARRIGDESPAVGVVAVVDELLALAFGAQAQRLVG